MVEVLANDATMQGIVRKLTKLGLHFAKSTAGAGAFAAWQAQQGRKVKHPMSYSPTRWNALYLAMCRYMELHEELVQYVAAQRAQPSSSHTKGHGEHVDRVSEQLLDDDELGSLQQVRPLF